ncbi:hypothetical protein [Paraliobacillus ryukyuensis]|uniref:hypothetical protein n=1 Tax=Paraliobacillus ryukyuensis TaxID=200904 RepID=UPI0009A8E5BA|nr:hypothetical protein [Paraliobacillus ryukyuensis]
MGKFKNLSRSKKVIIAASIFLGCMAVGGTVYGVAKNNQHQQMLDKVKTEIMSEQSTTDKLDEELRSYQVDDGYLVNHLTQDNIDSLKNSIGKIKDSSADFEISTSEFSENLQAIKTDKLLLEEELDRLERKFKLQKMVNELFIQDVISENGYKTNPLSKDVKQEDIDNLSDKVKEINNEEVFFKAISKALEDANDQFSQISLAKSSVSNLFKDNEVLGKVKRDQYNDSKKLVEKVKNEEVKKELSSKLDKVLTSVEKKEEAKKEAEEEARRKAETRAQTQEEHSSRSTSSSSNNTSSSNSSSSANSGSSSTSSSKSGGNSSSSSSKSSSSGSSEGSSSNSSSGSKSSGSSASGSGSKSGNVAKDVKKTTEGKVYNEDGTQSGTAEGGTFTWDE